MNKTRDTLDNILKVFIVIFMVYAAGYAFVADEMFLGWFSLVLIPVCFMIINDARDEE